MPEGADEPTLQRVLVDVDEDDLTDTSGELGKSQVVAVARPEDAETATLVWGQCRTDHLGDAGAMGGVQRPMSVGACIQ